ncbi:Polysaccharide chain length determinant protein domain-containing protein [Desulfonema limicola]|uniref:Polysaccharide chain length determinant protein domain-containing protein n=1 Tax=Desulfonema limicola TaxID=45656 RepID=A0A975GFA8_9BACT|nr:XrtA system polysaccharide chain length determinant [Desulfonema limicola]QTA79091.1 Polysaccharide chain length determinant protein domain-containing protein [Desulfonema limicola]
MSEDEKKQIDIDYYIKLILQRRWFLLIPFCISMSVGIYFAITLPKVYSASNLILIIPQSVPDKYVPSVVDPDMLDEIETIKQRILSRSNIEAIINEYDLFSGPKYKNMFDVDKIENFRKNTSVKVTKSKGSINSFIIEFKGNDPKNVMNVVNSLADSFINESLKLFSEKVFAINKFLQDELLTLRERLQQTENIIRKYREEHMGELPEELGSNLSTITRLQTQLSEKQENIRSAKNRISELEAQMALAKSNAMSISSVLTLSRPNQSKGNADKPISDLEQLKENLKVLNSRYTEKHPDIIRLKNAIAIIESKEEHQEQSAQDNASDTDFDSAADLSVKNAVPKAFDSATLIYQTQYKEIIEEIKIYNDEIKQISLKIEEYQKRVENTPKRETAIIDLKRNYENIKGSYNNLLDKKLASDIAVNMEKQQKGQKFRAIDRARLPRKPISPDMKILLVLFVAGGLGIGGGVIFLMDFLDQSLKKPEELESLTGIPLLATIPEIYTRKDRIKHKINHAMSLCAAMAAFLLFAVFAVFTLKGVERTLKFIEKII